MGFVKRVYTSGRDRRSRRVLAGAGTLLPAPDGLFAARTYLQLRLAPSKNNQRARVNWADDYAFEATIERLGAVAQLGERRAGSAKVRGSSPLGSMT